MTSNTKAFVDHHKGCDIYEHCLENDQGDVHQSWYTFDDDDEAFDDLEVLKQHLDDVVVRTDWRTGI